MIPITGVIRFALGFFKVPITVIDTEYVAVNGVDKRATKREREVWAGVEPSSSLNMERMFGGSVAAGDISVYTEENLFIDDTYSEDAPRRQSFVEYQGEIYRVANRANWNPQAGINVYLCKKHFDPVGRL